MQLATALLTFVLESPGMYVSGHSFICGLNTNKSSVGDIEELMLIGCPLEVAALNKSHSLRSTTKLHLSYCQTSPLPITVLQMDRKMAC